MGYRVTKPDVVVEDATKGSGDILDTTAEGGRKRWRAGTLTYTQGQLINVFFWLLWGDFCLNVMEFVIPRLLPPALGRLGASNALIALLTGSLFSAMNWVMNPWISTWSDRHRGPRGRRIPFMLWPTPPLAAAVIFVGFAGNMGAWIWHAWPGLGSGLARFFAVVLPDMTGLSPAAQLGIGMVAVALVLYKFFDLFPQCVYYYIWADVVPQEMMGRFTSLFRVFAAAAGFVFHRWILTYADTHPGAIYIGCALLYLTAFMLLSLLVKEGDYPPPPPKERNALLKSWQWVKECFTYAYYWKFFAVYSCFRWAFVPFNAMLIVLAKKGVGVTSEDFGHAMGWAQAAQMPVFFLLGPVVDRFHPVRVGVVGYAAMALSGVLGFFLTSGPGSFTVWLLASQVAIAMFQGALVSLGPRLLPRTRYGQFCAATMMVVEIGVMVLSWACGKMMDVFGERYLWLWLSLFSGLGVVATVVLYRAWMREGGDDAYVPPGGFDGAACAVKATQ